MILKIMLYAVAMAAAFSVVGLCLERIAAWRGRPRRHAWTIALLCSVLWPTLAILRAEPTAPLAQTQVLQSAASEVQVSTEAGPALTASPENRQSARASAGEWGMAPLLTDRHLLVAWGIASLLCLAHLIAAQARLRRRITSWEAGTLHGYPVLLSETAGPALVGVLQPRMVIPNWLLDEPHATQRLVLEHEQQHMAARDPLLIRAGALLLAAFPWNLPLWWQWRRMRHAIELDCDARVLRTGVQAENYGEVLLATVERGMSMPAGVVAMSEPVSALERRIQNLLPDVDRHMGLKARLALVLLAASIGAACSMSAPPLPEQTAPEAAASLAAVASPAPAQATLQAETPASPTPAVQPAPAPTASVTPPQAQSTAAVADPEPANPAAMETGFFAIKHATAKALAAQIQTGSGIGLLSAAGTLTTDERTNTILVRDMRDNVAAMRTLIAKLDVPVEQLMISGLFAMVDEDLVEELIATAAPDKRAMPVVEFPSDQAMRALLDAGQQANRAEIIARPQLIAANRLQASIGTTVDLIRPEDPAPPMTTRQLMIKLAITPTIHPDDSIQLDLNTKLDRLASVVLANGVKVPSIDVREVLFGFTAGSGSTVLVDLTKGDRSISRVNGTSPERKQRLIALLTLKRLGLPVTAAR